MEPEFCFESRNRSCLKIVHPLPLRVVLYIFFVLLIILTVCGNLLVTVSVAYFKQLHTPTNYLIASLAVSDLLVGVIIMFPGMIQFLESCWYFGDFLCKVSLSFNVTLITASIINLCFISIDRYYAVCQPLLYRSRITDNTVFVMIAVTWGASVFIGFGIVFFKLNLLGRCSLFQTKLSSIISSVLSFYLPGVILLGVYLKILLVAQKQFRSIQRAGCRWESPPLHSQALLPPRKATLSSTRVNSNVQALSRGARNIATPARLLLPSATPEWKRVVGSGALAMCQDPRPLDPPTHVPGGLPGDNEGIEGRGLQRTSIFSLAAAA
ncbi:trace amine-associated receptor 4-like [Halichoeres trimaculatus]|uniref:trace amine-associated receptor 4-like n=1 Tax=Halichoeres trimaculatus TaxID=147232 RepID=UPI003D9ED543